MKKVPLLIAFALLGALPCDAQTFSEWFRQKKTQLKYLREQIAALMVFGNLTKGGYAVTEKGTTLIGEETGTEYQLHRDYFRSLFQINPAVKGDHRVGAITKNETMIAQKAGALRRFLLEESSVQEGQQKVIERVLQAITRHSQKTLEALTQVLTPGALELTDNQRLERISDLFHQSRDRLVFLQSFVNTVAGLTTGQKREAAEIQFSKIFNQWP